MPRLERSGVDGDHPSLFGVPGATTLASESLNPRPDLGQSRAIRGPSGEQTAPRTSPYGGYRRAPRIAPAGPQSSEAELKALLGELGTMSEAWDRWIEHASDDDFDAQVAAGNITVHKIGDGETLEFRGMPPAMAH